jgi:alpha-N-acetylglucosamine transferase
MTYRRGFTSKRFFSRTDIDQQALPYVDHDALIDENMDKLLKIQVYVK